jgi:acetyl esterase/lipase
MWLKQMKTMQTKNSNFFIIAGLSLLLSCKKSNEQTTPPPTPPIQKEYLDISYATGSNAQKMDIFLPDTVKEKNPVLMWIHGGGWKGGDKSEFRNSSRLTELKKRGYAVVVINYRLSGEAKFPAQIFDVKAAIRWVKANAATYKFNPDKIGVWGSSAGGHLSALAGTSGNVAELEDLNQGNSSFSSAVQVVVDWYGPTDFLKMDSLALAQGCTSSTHNDANSPESMLIGFQITTRPDLVAKANPITYISNDDPPFFIEHGLIDCTVPYGQSQLLYNQLLPVLGPQKVKIKLLDVTGHGGGLFSAASTVTEAIDFLDTYLK